MECIGLMIVVAIIGILAAIALPAYQTYVQKSANNACLGEAKSAVNAAIAEMASEGKLVSTYTPAACDATASADAIAALAADETIDGAELTFTPLTRGASADLRTTTCDTATGTCALDAAAP